MRNARIVEAVLVLFLMLAVVPCGFGYGIDGMRSSEDFVNSMGPSPGYGEWAFEGGTPADPLQDVLGNGSSSYDTVANYSHDANDPVFMNHTDSPGGNLSGPYKYANGFSPLGADKYTMEWRMRVNNLAIYDNLIGWFWGMYTDDGSWGLRFLSGYWTNYVDLVNYPGGQVELPYSINEWRTYRVTVLGEDPDDPGVIKANFFQDGVLLAEEFVVDDWGSNCIVWMGVNWNWEVGQIDADVDYVRVDSTGAWAPVPEKCGDYGTEYEASDINGDCYVDLGDYEQVASDWMRCTDPANGACEKYPLVFEDFEGPVWNPGGLDTVTMSDGTTNGWDITHTGSIWSGGIVYHPSYSALESACLRGRLEDAGSSTITRDIGEQTAGSVAFGYTNGYNPDFGGKVQLLAFDTVVFEMHLGTAWSGSAFRGFILTDACDVLLPVDDLSASLGQVAQVSFAWDVNDGPTSTINSIDVRSVNQDWNHARTTSIPFAFPLPYVDQVRFIGGAAPDPFNPGDPNLFTGYFCFTREDDVTIDIPVAACGDLGTTFLDSDIMPIGAPDCYVGLEELVLVVSQWLECTDPAVADCYLVPVEPKAIIPHVASISVDGFLGEWADAEWIPLDLVYFGDPCDIPYLSDPNSAMMALKWSSSTNKVYAAITVDDMDHVFESSPSYWDTSDRIEVYAQGDPNGGVEYGANGSGLFDIAQQYAVGYGGLTQGVSWGVFGDGTYLPGALDPDDAEFEHSVRTSGSTITYEIGAKMFIFYGGHHPGIDSEVRQLAVGQQVGFDVVVNTKHGPAPHDPDDGDLGMLSENLMLNKYINADKFQRYELGE